MLHLLLILTVSLSAAEAPKEPALRFQVAGKPLASFKLSELQAKLKSEKITFFSPFSNKDKTYEAFKAADVLSLAFGDDWRSEDYSDVGFMALDGYEAVGTLSKLRQDGGYVAFRDLDVPKGWEKVGRQGRKAADPAPFFLVWVKDGQSTENEFPWPWQIAIMNLLRFEDQYPAVVPTGAAKDSAEWRGFKTFKGRCFRCHAMNQQGGRIGPDLNSPQNITAYRPKDILKEYIREPSQFRYTYMPDHADFSDEQLEDLYLYLKFQAKDAGKTW